MGIKMKTIIILYYNPNLLTFSKQIIPESLLITATFTLANFLRQYLSFIALAHDSVGIIVLSDIRCCFLYGFTFVSVL